VSRIGDLLTGRTTALLSVDPAATWGTPAPAAVAPVAVTGGGSAGVTAIARMITDANEANKSVALSVPAVRKARHVIAGTVSTFALSAWDYTTKLAPNDPRSSWLRQPDPARTLQQLLFRTVDDAIWYDRAVWLVLDRSLSGLPVKFRHIDPTRLSSVPDSWDQQAVSTWTVDGRAVPADRLVVFDFAGLGGLRRFGIEVLQLYMDLQAAAGRYAKEPHPQAVLRNHGADLTAPAIAALLDEWEAARSTRSVGYLNDVVDYETFGWDAAQLQLTEGREHAALEVARLFGLPARAVDAPTGSSMTYANVAESRRDILEALRPWMTVIEQTLSLNDRWTSQPRGMVLPYGLTAQFDVDAYTRDAPVDRMSYWSTALAANILTLEEVRAAEPLATTTTPPTPVPPPAAPASVPDPTGVPA
jgi:HK97 family phage portal protein